MSRQTLPSKRQKLEETLGVGKRRANQVIAQGSKLNAAKLKKEQATAKLRESQAAKAKLELDVARGELVSRAAVASDATAIGLAIKASLRAWASSLPGRLEGLSAGDMSEIIDEEITRVLRLISSK